MGFLFVEDNSLLVTMALLRVLLVSCAILVLVHSLPSTTRITTEDEQHTNLQANETMEPNIQQVAQPTAVLNEDLENETQNVEFVYNISKKNMKVEKGSDHDQYKVNDISNENPRNVLELKKIKLFKDSRREMEAANNMRKEGTNSADTQNKDAIVVETYFTQDQWSLTPKELSSEMGGLPKYVYDLLKPIPPFPEMKRNAKQNGGMISNTQTEHLNPTLIKVKAHQPPHNAGPVLYPESIYSRAFDLPFFD